MFSKKSLPVVIVLVLSGLLITFNSSGIGNPPDKYQLIFQQVTDMLEAAHYSPKKVDDVFSQNIDNGRAEIADCIPILQKVAKDKPNSMLLNVFFTAKADELVNIFGKAIPSEKAKVTQALSEIDPTNNSKYQQILKSN